MDGGALAKGQTDASDLPPAARENPDNGNPAPTWTKCQRSWWPPETTWRQGKEGFEKDAADGPMAAFMPRLGVAHPQAAHSGEARRD